MPNPKKPSYTDDELNARLRKLKDVPDVSQTNEADLQARYEKLRTNAKGEVDKGAYFPWKYTLEQKMENIQQQKKLLQEQSRMAAAVRKNNDTFNPPKPAIPTMRPVPQNENQKLKNERDIQIKKINLQTHQQLVKLFGKEPNKKYNQLKTTKENLIVLKSKLTKMKQEAYRLPPQKRTDAIKRLSSVEGNLNKKIARIDRKMTAGTGLMLAGRKAKEMVVQQYKLKQKLEVNNQKRK